MSKKLLGLALILSFAVVGFAALNLEASPELTSDWVAPENTGETGWFSAPKAIPNGWYWMYDNTEAGPPFNDPIIAPMPTFGNIWQELSTDAGASKLAPYNDEPYQYTMVDSFWYYGAWYEPGDYMYISPDGWISWDNASEGGFPNPPTTDDPFPNDTEPHAIIAPLWQDHNPTQTAEPATTNRVFYKYAADTRIFSVEWHEVEGYSNTNWYTFELLLAMGGQDKLVVEGDCGVVFSYHYITFLYQGTNNGWTADNLLDPPAVGIEDQTGDYGIYYQGTLANSRQIRAGYKMIFRHDVQAYAYISPGSMVLRWTDIEPQVIVRNIGEETEHFPATLEIYDEENTQVYRFNVGGFDLTPGEWDTLEGPCWTPGEIGQEYEKICFTDLERDECRHNDTVVVTSFVHCDDTFRYDWNFADQWAIGWGIRPPMYFLTFYPVDNGVLATGGQSYVYSVGSGYAPPQISLWEPATGCGATNASGMVGSGDCTTLQVGWNRAQFGGFGIFAMSGNPGNVFAGTSSSSTSQYSGYYGAFAMDPFPAPHACYQHPNNGLGRAAYINGSSFTWGHYGDEFSGFYTVPIELYVHLGFGPFPLSPMALPPCYYDEAHDITAFRMEEPNIDYVEAGEPITPEIAIANIGRAAEPYSGFFPVTFMAINEETSDTTYRDSTMINDIGFLGDDADDPDTLFVTTPPWTPEGICRESDPFVYYELIGLVRLGEVGPDESDHCPYNDTVRRNVTCLLSHDVGVIELVLDPGPDAPPDIYNVGTAITATATVENFGYNDESDIPVRLEVKDKDSNDVLHYNNIQSIPFLDWRGNVLENPYTTEVTFPPYTNITDHWQTLEARTEMVGDDCPDDDFEVVHINSGVVENGTGPAFALEAITPNPFVGSTTISFAVPHTANVSLKVYDISGKLVNTLVDGNMVAGHHNITWDGSSVSKGIYLVRMDSESFSATKKVVVY